MSNPDCKADCGFICHCGFSARVSNSLKEANRQRRKPVKVDIKTTIDPVTGLKIKSCPFCGASASIEEIPPNISDTDFVRFAVGCDSGEEATCIGYQSLTTFDRRKDAIEAWNKRA